jgi:hypothetical protein
MPAHRNRCGAADAPPDSRERRRQLQAMVQGGQAMMCDVLNLQPQLGETSVSGSVVD